MALINTTNKNKVYVGGVDMSDLFIEGSLTDSSVLSNALVNTTGSLTFHGGDNNQYLDFEKTQFPIATQVKVWVALDNGRFSIHPRGTLYIIDSSVSIDDRTLTLEVGCSLAFLAARENLYASAVEELFDFVPSQIAKYIRGDLSLSTLGSALETAGRVMFQDGSGAIRVTKQFGYDGKNGAFPKPKLTCFDTHTCLGVESISQTASEQFTSKITVEAQFEVPKLVKEETGDTISNEDDINPPPDDDDPEGDDFRPQNPPPYLRSTTRKTSYYTVLTGSIGTAFQSGESAAAAPCKYLAEEEEVEEGDGSVTEYQMVYVNGIGTSTKSFQETVSTGGVTRYRGTGNQISYEEDWEYGSAASFAGSYFSSLASKYEGLCSSYATMANNNLSKYNQAKQARDALESDDPKRAYHSCQMNYYYEFAAGYVRFANAVKSASNWLNRTPTMYAVGSLSKTFNKYDRTGALKQQIKQNWKHFLAGSGGLQATYGTSIQRHKYYYQGLLTHDVLFLTTPPPYRGTSRPYGRANTRDMVLANETTTNYTQGNTYNRSIEDYIDYEDSSRSYRRISYSSGDNNTGNMQDRLVTSGVDGIESMEEEKNKAAAARGQVAAAAAEAVRPKCRIETETRTITASIQTAQPSSGNPVNTQQWFGTPQPIERTITLPSDLMPDMPEYDEQAQRCLYPSYGAQMLRATAIMKDYARNTLKKTIGDQIGFRVIEKMRPEIYGYHPCYPVVLSLEALNKAYKCRASSATWALDSNESVCSLDLIVLGQVSQPAFSSPTVRKVKFKTDFQVVSLTRDQLGFQTNATSVKIDQLPTEGTLEINGVAVTAGQVISGTDVDNGLVTITF